MLINSHVLTETNNLWGVSAVKRKMEFSYSILSFYVLMFIYFYFYLFFFFGTFVIFIRLGFGKDKINTTIFL